MILGTPQNKKTPRLLGVNVDHVATIRQARHTIYPDPLEAALLAIQGGADQITIHLREDRRHIVDRDLWAIRKNISVPLNLEMAADDEIASIACEVRPNTATIVPERRQELTTEGGLDVISNSKTLHKVISALKGAGISVSLFIDPELEQIDASAKMGADAVEFHTGAYCDAKDVAAAAREIARLKAAANAASKTGMKLCAGHGLNYENIGEVIRELPEIVEYNIGHSIVARAIFIGMERAVGEMKDKLRLGA